MASSLLVACDPQPMTTSAGGDLHVVATCTPESLTEALRQHPDATLVVALDVGEADVMAAVAAAGRAQQPFVVAVGRYAADAALPDALVAEATGAAAAVDLALLACNGIEPADVRYEIGTRTWTEANRRAGGAATLAPADPILAMLRQQHAGLLAKPAPDGKPHRVGFVLPEGAEPWQRAAFAEARAAGQRYPQLEVFEAGDPAAAIAAGARALLLATTDAAQTATAQAVASQAADGPRSVLVLDPLLSDAHGTCTIGCSPGALARAVAAQVRGLLPEGGRLLLCRREGNRATSAMRRNAFAEALGFDPAALR